MWEPGEKRVWWRYTLTGLVGAVAGAGLIHWLA